MKNFRGFALGLVIGLALAMSTIGLAQNSTQADPAKEKASCCSVTSCCCGGDSCAMKHNGNHDGKKHDSAQGCCCCGSDSCDIKMKEQKEKAE
jgi:hypothetical protein